MQPTFLERVHKLRNEAIVEATSDRPCWWERVKAYDIVIDALLVTLPASAPQPDNANDTMEYWRSRAITAEGKVLEFHAQIAALAASPREAGEPRPETAQLKSDPNRKCICGHVPGAHYESSPSCWCGCEMFKAAPARAETRVEGMQEPELLAQGLADVAAGRVKPLEQVQAQGQGQGQTEWDAARDWVMNCEHPPASDLYALLAAYKATGQRLVEATENSVFSRQFLRELDALGYKIKFVAAALPEQESKK